MARRPSSRRKVEQPDDEQHDCPFPDQPCLLHGGSRRYARLKSLGIGCDCSDPHHDHREAESLAAPKKRSK